MNVHETLERAMEACGVHCSRVQTFAMKLSHFHIFNRKHFLLPRMVMEESIMLQTWITLIRIYCNKQLFNFMTGTILGQSKSPKKEGNFNQ